MIEMGERQKRLKRLIVVGRIATAVAFPLVVIGASSVNGEAAPINTENTENAMQIPSTSTPVPGVTRTPTPNNEILGSDALTKIAAIEPYIQIGVQKGTDAQERSFYLSTRVAELENRDVVQTEMINDLKSKNTRFIILGAIVGGVILGTAMARRHELIKTSIRRGFGASVGRVFRRGP